MSALVLDAGALVAIDRDDRAMIARLRVAHSRGIELRSNAVVVGQVWRNRSGRQANLARLLRAVDVQAVTEQDGRRAGELLGSSGTSDVVDASLVVLARSGDQILTSDPRDMARLVSTSRVGATVVAC